MPSREFANTDPAQILVRSNCPTAHCSAIPHDRFLNEFQNNISLGAFFRLHFVFRAEGDFLTITNFGAESVPVFSFSSISPNVHISPISRAGIECTHQWMTSVEEGKTFLT